jgi:hypothetical protein
MICFVKTLRLYFVTKTKCTCIRKTQCLPVLNSIDTPIDQVVNSAAEYSKDFKCFSIKLSNFDLTLLPSNES